MRTPFKWHTALLLLLATLLTGCGPLYVNKYTPPAKLADVNCLNTCTREAKRCNYQKQQQYKTDQFMYESNKESYERCKVGRNSKQIYKDCQGSDYTSSWFNYNCEEDYDSCYLACGGTIERVPLQDAGL